ncbi:hypothetical protein [Streptomyces sp. NPDC006285]|uniref:hypothetical protein n=1 Tax=Streptomyces sp. NPDC006285 TaxID=3364742 RepID=UPI00367F99DB
MITRIEIDPNVRVRGNGTRAGFEDVSGPLAVNMDVEVYEPESELVGPARVTEIDTGKQLVFLSVDWANLEFRPGAGAPAADEEDSLAEVRSLPTLALAHLASVRVAEVHVLPVLAPARPTSAPVRLPRHAGSGLLTFDGNLHEAAGQKHEELVVTAL